MEALGYTKRNHMTAQFLGSLTRKEAKTKTETTKTKRTTSQRDEPLNEMEQLKAKLTKQNKCKLKEKAKKTKQVHKNDRKDKHK